MRQDEARLSSGQGALFLLTLLARGLAHGKAKTFGRRKGAFGALLRVKGPARKYVAVAR